MERDLHRSVSVILEYLPGAACAFVLGMSFGMAGGIFAFGFIRGRWPHSGWLFPLFGLFFAGMIYALFELMRRIHGIEVSRGTRRRERRAWLVAPPLGILMGAASAAAYLLF